MAKQTFTTGQVLSAAQVNALQANDYNQTVSAKVASYVLVAADAGTTITMSNASATTVTANTALFAAGDTLRITNIGAGVCTITAGTATVTTSGVLTLAQWATGIFYFTSTGAAIFFGSSSGGMTNPMTTTGDTIYSSSGSTPARLGIGSTGNVLTVAGGVPSWAAPSGSSGAMTQIASTTISGSSATDITFSSIASSYNHLMIILQGKCASGSFNGTDFGVQLNSDTGSNYTTARNVKYAGAGGTVTIEGTTTAQMYMGNIWCGNANSNAVGSVFMTFPSYKETTLYKTMTFQGGSWADAPAAGSGQARWNNTTAITTIKLYSPGGGNLAIGTTATLYGLV